MMVRIHFFDALKVNGLSLKRGSKTVPKEFALSLVHLIP